MATDLIAWRGRNDDGNETTATWKAAQGVAWAQPVDVNFRVRFLVQNSTSAINNLDVQLQYNLNSAGWVNVSATSNVVRASASPNVADQANLTSQLTGGSGTFEGATAFDEADGICGGTAYDIAATEYFEHEFCCQLRSADVVNGDTIQLRSINSDSGAAWTAYTAGVASMTAAKSVSITPPVGALALAGVAPAVIIPELRTPTVGTLSMAGIAPLIQLSGGAFQPGAFQADAFQVDATEGEITPSLGAMVLSGMAGRMDFGVIIPTELNQ